ncbi:hypothetical protein ABW21_db0207587 [Orbilia brochopaga]|nr:hypothetical protein ABW21_db0207587 [Drechslerella brochopaga]
MRDFGSSKTPKERWKKPPFGREPTSGRRLAPVQLSGWAHVLPHPSRYVLQGLPTYRYECDKTRVPTQADQPPGSKATTSGAHAEAAAPLTE